MKPKLSIIPQEAVVHKRLKRDWIEAYCEDIKETSSPFIMREWAAITAVSGALERKVWMRSRRMDLYPNLYTILVGPPGVGKTVAVDPVRVLWRKLDGVCVATSNVSRASVVDQLARANRTVVRPETIGAVSFNSLLVASNELQVFLSAYEGDFIGVLTDLYDCKVFSEEKRTRETKIDIERPQLVILAATTPSYLNGLFADAAWDQGFASRTIFIYSGEVLRGDIFVTDDEIEDKDLVHDLRAINGIYGKYVWEQDAAEAITAWYKTGGDPAPAHPKLMHYLTRRHTQVLKLCMIAAASESNELVIKMHHYQRALGWLLNAESFMPDIFKATMGSDRRVMDECWHYTYTVFVKTGKPLLKAKVLTFLSDRAPIHSIDRLYDMMVRTGRIKERTEKEGTCCEPQPEK